jgi:hypothetical protein
MNLCERCGNYPNICGCAEAKTYAARLAEMRQAMDELHVKHGRSMRGIEQLEARLAEAERDAARYRFLQAESKRFDPVLGVTCKVHFDRNGSDWCNIVDLDATVDRCRATDSADDAPEKCLDCGKTIDLCGCAL